MSQQPVIRDIARRVYAPLDSVFIGIEEHLADHAQEDSYDSGEDIAPGPTSI